MPLDNEVYEDLSIDEIGIIDQFLFRFSKLQDSMGEKLFPIMLLLLEEDYSKKPFVDLLNRLEKMGLLYKNNWVKLRKIRNSVSHEYSYNTIELVEGLNSILAVKEELLKIYDRFLVYCFDKFEFIVKTKK